MHSPDAHEGGLEVPAGADTAAEAPRVNAAGVAKRVKGVKRAKGAKGAKPATVATNATGDSDAEATRGQVLLSPRTTGAEVAMRWLPTLFQHPYADRILTEFRWQAYLRANPDVAANAKDAESALRHFYFNGYYERRIFDRDRLKGFDGGFYRERFPELGLVDDAEAQVHYCYLGFYEGRPANRDEAWLLDVDLHVFQMGKVGSHSIAAALEACGSTRHVIQLHWMADFHRAHPALRLPYRRLLHGERDAPMQVLSGTREIVSWALASLFQYFGHGVSTLEEARAMVELRFWETCQAGLTWFDHRYFCDLDVYATPFPHAEGAVRLRHGALDLLVYRQEDMARLSPVMADFLSLPGFSLGRANDGERKAYSGLYREFLQRFRLPGDLLARLYEAPMMRHFYSDDEREAAYRRWVG